MSMPADGEKAAARRGWRSGRRGVAGLVALFVVLNLAGIWWIRQDLRGEKGALKVATVEPDGEASVRPVIVVRFTRPVLPAPGEGGAEARPSAGREALDPKGLVRLEPATFGETLWAGRDTLLFYPQEDLDRGKEYRIVVSPEAGGAVGLPLEGPREFRFTTGPVELVSAVQVGYSKRKQVAIRLVFNDDLSTDEIRRMITVKDPKGEDISFQVNSPTWRNTSTITCWTLSDHVAVGLRSTAQRKSLARTESLQIPRPMLTTSPSRPRPRGRSVVRNVSIRRTFRVTRFAPETVSRGAPRLGIVFSSPPAENQVTEQDGSARPANLAEFFRVEPAVAFTTSRAGSEVFLNGEFQPASTYVVTVRKGLRGAASPEARLEADRVQEVVFPDRPPSISLKDGGARLSSAGGLAVRVETTHVSKLTARASRVYPNSLVHYLKMRSRFRDHFVRAMPPRTYLLSPDPNEVQELAIDLRDLTGPDVNGIWFIEVFSSGARRHNLVSDHRLITVSDLGISAKVGADRVHVWATSLRQAQPVAGARAALWSRKNQLLAEVTTGPDGLAEFPSLPEEDGESPEVLTVSKGNDTSYLDLGQSSVSLADFDLDGRPYLRAGYAAYLFCERGVYRPGETVHLKGLVTSAEALQARETPPGPGEEPGETAVPAGVVLADDVLADGVLRDGPQRGAGGCAVGPLPVQVEILRPDRKRFRLLKATVSPGGAVEIAVPVPASAPTGRYRARIRLPASPGEDSLEEIGSTSFRVEEFFPNRIETHVEMAGDVESPRLRPGEKAEFIVHAKYLFGLPAEGCAVAARWGISARPFRPSGWEGFRFGEISAAPVSVRDSAGKARLDADGIARFSVTIPEIETASALSLLFQGEVRDVSGRPVAAQMRVPVDAAGVYVGLRLAEGEAAETGRSVRFECVALTPDEQLADLQGVDLTASRVQWTWVYKKNSSGRYVSQSHEEVEEVSRRHVVLSGGRGAFELSFDGPGTYRLRLRDPASPSVAELELRVRRPGVRGWTASGEAPERVELSLDRSAYAPGSTARLLVRSPFAGTLLLTTETDRVETARVLPMPENSLVVDVPLPDDGRLANVYLAASVVRPVEPQARWQPHRAYGMVNVPLDFSRRNLHVSLLAEEEILPAAHGRLRVAVTGLDGAPVPGADVTVALVDAGILSLTGYQTPDPFEFFYGKKAHEVTFCDNYGELLAEVSRDVQRSRPGGGLAIGAGEGLLSPVTARRVKSAVLWLGSRATGQDGMALLDFDAPEFTGQLRLYAVASKGAARFGSADVPVLVRAPFFFELGLPRFLAPGDLAQASVRLFNRTETGGEAILQWELDGIEQGLAPPAANLAFASLRDDSVDLAPDGSGSLVVPLRAAQRVGKATVSLTAALGDATYHESVELPVRPAAPRVTRTLTGKVTADAPLEVHPEITFLPGTFRGKLRVSAFPDVGLTAAIRYLIRYPYGCLEQTTSKVLPLVYLRDLAERLQLDAQDSKGEARVSRKEMLDIDQFVMAGIERIIDMQSPAGWLSMWPGGRSPWRWGTAYATQFLLEARAAGYPVPGEELRALLDYVKSDLAVPRRKGTDGDTLVRAYALYDLALAGDPQKPGMDLLREEAGGRLSRSARCLLAAAYFRTGDAQTAKSLLEMGEGKPTTIRDTGGSLRSPAREAALLLATLLDVDPQSSLIPQLVEDLRGFQENGRWGTTQENAFAVLALGKYARRLSDSGNDFEAKVRLGEQEPLTIGPKESKVLSFSKDTSPIDVTMAGSGTLFYSVEQSGVPVKGLIEDVDAGLKVRRRYLDAQGRPLDPLTIQAGAVVVVEISLEADRSVNNVVVTDLLPAGLEVENPNLKGRVTALKKPVSGPDSKRAGNPSRRVRNLTPSYTSLRDDRVLLFFNVPASTPCVHHHVCRAVTRGEFRLPPVQAEAMYAPQIRSLSGGGRCVVR